MQNPDLCGYISFAKKIITMVKIEIFSDTNNIFCSKRPIWRNRSNDTNRTFGTHMTGCKPLIEDYQVCKYVIPHYIASYDVCDYFAYTYLQQIRCNSDNEL